VHAHYLGKSGLVGEVERNLKNLDEISRYLSKLIAKEIDPETRPVLEDVKLAGDVDDNKPLGGAERDAFRGDDGGFDGGFDSDGEDS
jgi:small subunit ribosomal protein S6